MMATVVLDPFARPGWWDESCRDFASLRSVTSFRWDLLRHWVPDWQGRTVVDLGCGGGLLAARAAAAGARVVGVDRAVTALLEACRCVPAGRFLAADIRRVPLADATADVVLLADVLEHVDRPADVVAEAARLLRPGGRLFVNTINRTFLARLLAVTLGEGLGLIPRGTHDARRFVRPDELVAMAAAHELRLCRTTGEAPRLFATLRRWTVVLRATASTKVGYAQLFTKDDRP